MAIITMWDNREKQAVRMEFETEWTWKDLEAAIDATDKLIASVPHQVDVIIDIEGANLPKDFMSAAKNLLANPQPRSNEGNRVVVGAGSMVKTGYQTIKMTFGEKLVGREVLFAANLPQARAMLRDLRPANPER
ncbi:MAG: hypothetical protein MUE40_09620 [Anaerolineae bacterium]|jgi:hypothetical protein|nr:hypothetical protein [Anaerolineae bacterium]